MKAAAYSSPPKFHRAARDLLLLLTLALLVFMQFQNLFLALTRDSSSSLFRFSHLLPRVFFLLIFATAFWLRLLESLADPRGRRSGGLVRKVELPLAGAVVLFLAWAFFSGAVNGNPPVVTANGAYVYVAYFLVFFAYSSIDWSDGQIWRIYRPLLGLAVFLSAVSVVQEVLALINPASAQWWPNIHRGGAMWRMGLFRAPSLLGHPNTIAILALFFLTVELGRRRGRSGRWMIIILAAAVIFSASRLAMLGGLLALVAFRPFFRRLAFLAVPALIAAGLFWRAVGPPAGGDDRGAFAYDAYRDFARKVSLRVIADNPAIGVGPGRYGGHVSLKYRSPVYEEYGFTGRFVRNLERNSSIEQQWLQAAAELGVVGLMVFLLLLLAPAAVALASRAAGKDPGLRRLASALAVVPLQMVIFLPGFTVTQQGRWLVLYFILLGMLSTRRSLWLREEGNAER